MIIRSQDDIDSEQLITSIPVRPSDGDRFVRHLVCAVARNPCEKRIDGVVSGIAEFASDFDSVRERQVGAGKFCELAGRLDPRSEFQNRFDVVELSPGY